MTVQKNAAKGSSVHLGKSPSKHKHDATTSEHQGGLVQIIGYAAGAAGAAVTSGVKISKSHFTIPVRRADIFRV